MSVELNHTIVACTDKHASAAYLVEMLDLPAPTDDPPFRMVELTNSVSLAFQSGYPDITPQHYAFLISEAEFDGVYGRLTARGQEHWADPHCSEPGFNTNDGGRGTYFCDPDGHLLEVITRPYGSGNDLG